MSLMTELQEMNAEQASLRLLGATITRETGSGDMSGKIVETEAYSQDDPSSHSYRGQTLRNSAMFGPAGRSYVYFTYGMHFCLNIVVGVEGRAEAVLVRAIEPMAGLNIMRQNRGLLNKQHDLTALTNGPAKLTQAMGIDLSLNKHDLSLSPLRLELKDPLLSSDITRTTRIGLSKDTDKPLRFYIKDNKWVSRP